MFAVGERERVFAVGPLPAHGEQMLGVALGADDERRRLRPGSFDRGGALGDQPPRVGTRRLGGHQLSVDHLRLGAHHSPQLWDGELENNDGSEDGKPHPFEDEAEAEVETREGHRLSRHPCRLAASASASSVAMIAR